MAAARQVQDQPGGACVKASLDQQGRIGQAGKVRSLHFPSQEEATRALLELEAAKKRRGYWLRPKQLELF